MIDMVLVLVASALFPAASPAQHQHSRPSATKARPATPRSDVTQLFGRSNYPPGARAKGLEGRNEFVLTVDATGMVIGCTITTSAGHRELDDGSCRIARRLRFDPARDERGRGIVSQFPMQADWRLDAI